MVKKLDIIIIISLIIISFIPGGVYWYLNGRNTIKGTYAEITIDGNLYKTVPLSNHKGTDTFTIKTKYGYNIIEVRDNQIAVIDADCPDKIDVKMGFVKKPGDTLVCLPHRLIVEIKGDYNEEDDDTILSY